MGKIAGIWSRVQRALFQVQECLPPLSEQQYRVIVVLEVVRMEEAVPPRCLQWLGRKRADRRALARAFGAKASLNLPTTKMLIERLRAPLCPFWCCSCSIAECIYEAFLQKRGEFCAIGVRRGHDKTLGAPELAAHAGEGVGEGRLRLGIPTGLVNGLRLTEEMEMGQQRHQREDPQERGGGAGDGLLVPLALGLHPQVGAHGLEGGLHLPAAHKPGNDLHRISREIGTQESLGSELAFGVANEHPA